MQKSDSAIESSLLLNSVMIAIWVEYGLLFNY